MMLTAGLLIAGATLHRASEPTGRIMMVAAAVTFLWGILSKR